MSFDQRVENTHQIAAANAVELILQQQGPLLRRYVTEKACTGYLQPATDIVGKVEVDEGGDGRIRSNPDNKAQRNRRLLVWQGAPFTGEYLDKRDMWLSAMDPTSELMMTHTAAVGRGIDRVILGVNQSGKITGNGILGSATNGGAKSTNTTSSLPAANTVPHGGEGMTIDKLKKVRENLALAHNRMQGSRPVIAMGAKQITDLFGVIYSGTDAKALNPLQQREIVEGHISRLLGMDIVEHQALPKDGTTRTCPVWLPEMIVLGVWQDVKTIMANDSSKGMTPYFRIDYSMDCVRKQDGGVMAVQCTEAA